MGYSSENDFEDCPSEYPLRYPLLFDHRHYVPRVLWKQGEYQALLGLHPPTKSGLTPLIDIPEIGYDFETGEDAKTVDEHLANFARRLAKKWGETWAFVDLGLIDSSERMSDGRHPLKFVFDDVRDNHTLAIPVTGLARDPAYQQAVLDTVSVDKTGVCIRLAIEDIVEGTFVPRLKALVKAFNVSFGECHLIIDLGAPNFEPLEGFTKMVCGLIGKLPQRNEWKTFTICGTSFPQTMGQLKLGVQIVKRHEWLFYKKLLSVLKSSERKPTFGDYAITHPDHATKDPRLLKPAASIRYTIDDAWYIAKGSNIRDNGTVQYVKHCTELIRSGLFLGNRFSAADEYIRKCAQRRLNPGNLTTWRRIGTNHHIEKAVFDLANLSGF